MRNPVNIVVLLITQIQKMLSDIYRNLAKYKSCFYHGKNKFKILCRSYASKLVEFSEDWLSVVLRKILLTA